MKRAPLMVVAAGAMALVLSLLVLPARALERVRVVVSERGFDPPVVEVTEGELVEITFVYGDSHLPQDNPHVIFIEGLRLESPQISRARPEVAVRFTAEQSGRLLFKCTAYCTGHDRLQAGYLSVRPASAAGPVPAVATVLQLLAAPPDVPGAKAALRAQLSSDDGQPVEGVLVRFEQQAALVKTGWAPVGSARTDPRGVALIEYAPFGDALRVPARAVFEGNVRYQPAEARAVLDLPALPSWWAPVAEVRVPVVGTWLLWLVVSAVWLTFAYVAYQVFTLPEPRAAAPELRRRPPR
ncbi:MAG: hypothetical protein HY334_04140 [Armatimonadetes bacterium]|nr:hypothetical protein [Armatimonadota bacterium]